MGFSLSKSISFRSKLLSQPSDSDRFTPQSIFASGEEGAWLQPIAGQSFTDTAGMTAAALDDSIGKITARAGTISAATQSDPNKGPLFKDPGAEFDGTDDAIEITIPTGGITGEMYYASSAGKGVFGVDFADGTRTFGNVNFANWRDTIYGLVLVDRSFTPTEVAGLDAEFDSVADDFNTLTNGFAMFRNSSLTSLPSSMTLPALTDARNMFRDNDIVVIPNGMRLSNLTTALLMFRGNTNLTTVPSDFAADSDCTNWGFSFFDTNLTQQSIDNILTNLAARGTSNGDFGQSGGSAPSAAGEAAIDAMRGRGWTITVTGGY